MSYSFRIRFNRSPHVTINSDQSKIILPIKNESITLSLNSSVPDTPLQKAEYWSLIGEGYSTEDEASSSGLYFQQIITVVFAQMCLGVDFGARAPKGTFTKYGEQFLSEIAEQKVLTDTHGLMTYLSDPKPIFKRQDVSFLVAKPIDSFNEKISSIIKKDINLSEHENLAFSLFNSSFFQPTADSRFLLLIMAIEALIKPQPKSAEAINHVNNFINQIKNSSLEKKEKDSLMGAARWLRAESISHSGKRIAKEKLGNKLYLGKAPDDFFSYVYGLRSSLVHGTIPYPTFQEVSSVVAAVETFTSDLLTSLYKQQDPITSAASSHIPPSE